jgi:hypothetical protein
MMLSELVYDQNKILGLGLKLIPEPKMFASLYWITILAKTFQIIVTNNSKYGA